MRDEDIYKVATGYRRGCSGRWPGTQGEEEGGRPPLTGHPERQVAEGLADEAANDWRGDADGARPVYSHADGHADA